MYLLSPFQGPVEVAEVGAGTWQIHIHIHGQSLCKPTWADATASGHPCAAQTTLLCPWAAGVGRGEATCSREASWVITAGNKATALVAADLGTKVPTPSSALSLLSSGSLLWRSRNKESKRKSGAQGGRRQRKEQSESSSLACSSTAGRPIAGGCNFIP